MRQTCVARVAAVHGDERIEHRDVHDRNRARRATRSDLLAEHAVLAGRYRCVIESARIDRNFVPVNHPAAQVAAGRWIAEDRRRNICCSLVRNAENFIECRRSLGEGNE
jgi:hypothetical protein